MKTLILTLLLVQTLNSNDIQGDWIWVKSQHSWSSVKTPDSEQKTIDLKISQTRLEIYYDGRLIEHSSFKVDSIGSYDVRKDTSEVIRMYEFLVKSDSLEVDPEEWMISNSMNFRLTEGGDTLLLEKSNRYGGFVHMFARTKN